MRYEIIIVLTILVSLVLYVKNTKQTQRLKTGIRFCNKVIDLRQAYEEIRKVEADSSIKKRRFEGKYFQIEYESQKPKKFFTQMEFGIANAWDEYDKIKDQEFKFTEEDWDCITRKWQDLKELDREIKLENWKRGYKKVRG